MREVSPGVFEGGSPGLPALALPNITQFAYWSRWPTAKRQAFKQAAKSSIVLEDFIDMITDAKWVDLSLQALIDAHAQVVGMGMLTADESAAVLSQTIGDAERP